MADQWGFVRTRGNAQAYDDYHKMGLTGLLMNVEDPEFARGLNDAATQGFQGGLWIPGNTGADPIEYARQMAAYAAKYHPSILVPNIEYIGKGFKGGPAYENQTMPGWDWNEAMMAEFRRLNPTQKVAVSTMGEEDFNYGAYTSRDADIWGQSYMGNMDPTDPDNVRAAMLRAGADPSRLGIVLAPGGYARGDAPTSGVYTLDDLSPAQRTLYAQTVAAARASGSSPSTAHAAGVAAGASLPRAANPFQSGTGPRGTQFFQPPPVESVDARTAVLNQQALARAADPRSVAVQRVVQPPSRAQQTARRVVKNIR